jgi:hypothetical protein
MIAQCRPATRYLILRRESPLSPGIRLQLPTNRRAKLQQHETLAPRRSTCPTCHDGHTMNSAIHCDSQRWHTAHSNARKSQAPATRTHLPSFPRRRETSKQGTARSRKLVARLRVHDGLDSRRGRKQRYHWSSSSSGISSASRAARCSAAK